MHASSGVGRVYRVGASLDHIAAIDGLRGISILSVLIYHLNPAALPGGFVGVDVFFVISGFVVAKSIAAYPDSAFLPFLTRFYRRRMLRIVPALLICLAATVVLSALFIPSAWLSQTNDSVGISAFYGMSNFALWRTTGDYFSPTADFNPFTHTWSLAVEEQFYFVFPILAFALILPNRGRRTRRAAATVTLVLCLFSLAASMVMTPRDQPFAFYLLPTRFWELGAGVLLLVWMSGASPRRAGAPLARTFTAVALALLAVSLAAADASAFPFPWAIPPVAASVMMLWLVASGAGTGLARGLSTQPLLYLGKISYGLYLWHFAVIVLFRWTIGIDALWQQALAAALSIAIASASYHAIEAPIRFNRRIAPWPDWSIVAITLVCVGLGTAFATLGFHGKNRLSLSTTRDAAVWSPRGQWSLTVDGCTVAQRGEPYHGGLLITLTPQACSPGPQSRRIAVVGDFHAGAYVAMLETVAAATRSRVDVFQMPGCGLFSFNADEAGPPTAPCADFERAVLAAINSTLGPGDVLFLPKLRVPRFRNQWNGPVLENASLELAPVPADSPPPTPTRGAPRPRRPWRPGGGRGADPGVPRRPLSLRRLVHRRQPLLRPGLHRRPPDARGPPRPPARRHRPLRRRDPRRLGLGSVPDPLPRRRLLGLQGRQAAVLRRRPPEQRRRHPAAAELPRASARAQNPLGDDPRFPLVSRRGLLQPAATPRERPAVDPSRPRAEALRPGGEDHLLHVRLPLRHRRAPDGRPGRATSRATATTR